MLKCTGPILLTILPILIRHLFLPFARTSKLSIHFCPFFCDAVCHWGGGGGEPRCSTPLHLGGSEPRCSTCKRSACTGSAGDGSTLLLLLLFCLYLASRAARGRAASSCRSFISSNFSSWSPSSSGFVPVTHNVRE